MIAITYRKNGKWAVPIYMKDYQTKAAKQTLVEYETLHGKGNARMDNIDDTPLPEEHFWSLNWTQI